MRFGMKHLNKWWSKQFNNLPIQKAFKKFIEKILTKIILPINQELFHQTVQSNKKLELMIK
jgi:hypothetical protein